ncbi:unnamed protein product [Pseudo-nitzschia multistriata]|uniref:ADP-ribosylglycohydrolase n=1 Tax=Pseudo-nitzschia multistriata TaxID=183589 RepID=A0A448Z485_9STRA|nr:unnamed protein product [Pseudo-nitzschia multistriata]
MHQQNLKGNRNPRLRLMPKRLRIFYFASATLFGMGIFSTFQKKTVAGSVVTGNAPGRHASTVASGSELEDRLRGALWGFLAGDALASPTHWFYGGRRQVVSEYGHAITDYTKPNQHLSGSILNKSDMNGGGRSKFGASSGPGSVQTIIGGVINHGKEDLWSPSQSNHYHATLQKGENTLEASLARVLMKSIVATDGKFDADHFRDAYVRFMTTPGSHNDTYASTCHRMFFANLVFRRLPPKDCPDNDQHNVDTIDGLVLPTIVALAGSFRGGSPEIERSASDCAAVTRRSTVLERIAASWSGVVVEAVRSPSDEGFREALDRFSMETIRRRPNDRVRDDTTMSACYLGSSLPGLIDMVAKYSPTSGSTDPGDRVWEGLLANANVGGENVHRGSSMGAILGARAGAARLPSKLVAGLYPRSELEAEIDDFVRAVMPKPSQESHQ